MDKELVFLNLLQYLKKKHSLSFVVKKDNRRKASSVLLKDSGENVLTYTTKDFFTMLNVFHVAYHEIGHIMYKDDETTKYCSIYAEFIAERWQLDNLLIDFPSVYKRRCTKGKKQLDNWKEIVGNRHINYPHFIAWKMIKEYN